MRLSRAFVPTLKEAPSDLASTPFAMLVRAGFVRGRGDVLLPLGVRLFEAIVGVLVAEVRAIGGEGIALAPAASVGSGAREVASLDVVRRDVRSFRELPRIFYRIDAGRSPVARSLVVDAFAADDGRALGGELLSAVGRAFEALGLAPAIVVDGAGRVAFHVEGEGDAPVLACDRCAHAMLASGAVGRTDSVASSAPARALARVHTPNVGSVDAVAAFLGAPKAAFLKSIVHVTDDGRVVLAVVRGDHTVNPTLVARAASAASVRLASDEVVREVTGAAVGFAGPIGFAGTILVDRVAADVGAAIVGANETDHHYVGAHRGRDWDGEVVDLRNVSPGEGCPRCVGTLRARAGTVVARLAALGARPAESLGVTVTHEDQTRRPVTSTSLTVDLASLFAVLARACSHADGLRFPWAIAPYPVHVVAIGKDEPAVTEAVRIYDGVRAAGIAVALDDRDERAGLKFKDADLLGGVVRVTVGAKTLAGGKVEVKRRGGELELWSTDEVVARLVALRPPCV